MTPPHQLACPIRFPGGIARYGPAAISRAERGVFSVAGIRTRIREPIDWGHDPMHSSAYQRALDDLVWTDPLSYAYLHGGSRRALREELAILLDFVRQNPTPRPADRKVWERKRAADRVMRLAFVIRAAGCEGLLHRGQLERLLRATRAHARFLYRAGNTPLRSNHDLVQDLGLMSVRDYLPQIRGADRWYRAGNRRFVTGIRQLVDPRTGVHLEHTASYQFLTIERLASYLRLAHPKPPALVELERKMRRVASWFVMPDSTTVPFGDTPFGYPAPRYAVVGSRGDRGFSPTLRSGYAIVRRGGSYLATTAGYHRSQHKQADELSFDLFEDGHRVIVDSGRVDPGAGPRGAKAYSLSSQAHSTLTVDGKSFPLDGDYYGSALDAEGSGGGWYAIEGHNPLLRAQGVRHRRLFLYRPGVGLVVVDRLHSSRAHTYERFVQIAPELRASQLGDQTSVRGGGGFRATIWADGGGLRSKLLRGQLHPLRGWYAPPGISRLPPRDALRLRTRGASTTMATTLALGPTPMLATPTASGADVVLPSGRTVDLSVRRSGSRLRVETRTAGTSRADGRWETALATAWSFVQAIG